MRCCRRVGTATAESWEPNQDKMLAISANNVFMRTCSIVRLLCSGASRYTCNCYLASVTYAPEPPTWSLIRSAVRGLGPSAAGLCLPPNVLWVNLPNGMPYVCRTASPPHKIVYGS